MGKPCLSWARWRRLLLRLYTYVSLQVHQCMLEVCRAPQLRQVRRLQQQRKSLERRVHELHQAEQKITAEAAASSTTPTGTLKISSGEDRHRPLACIKGRGKYLVPMLEPSPDCTHPDTKHGANKYLTWAKCNKCMQEQKMPLTTLDQLQMWNERMVYIRSDFYQEIPWDDMLKDIKIKTKEAKESFMANLTKSPAGQSRTQSTPKTTSHLVWKCENPRCDLYWITLHQELEEATGIFLCPQCQSRGMILTQESPEEEDAEWQCMNPNCNMAMFKHELVHAYGRMGRFHEDLLVRH